MANFGVMEITTVIGCKVNCRYCPQSTLINNYVHRSKTWICHLY